MQSHIDYKINELQRVELKLSNYEKRFEDLDAINQKMKLQHSILKQRYDALKEEHLSLEQKEQKWMKQFENLSHKVIQKQSGEILDRHSRDLDGLLKPLKEKIKAFEQKVDQSNIDAVRRHESLKEQIKYLSDKSDKVSQDANNLAKALKGDFKKQGHWGELILESILDKSGLKKDREYFTQQSERDANGKIQRPDVVIKLPDDKVLVIDSKVSLSAYSALVDADNPEDQNRLRKSHLNAVRSHIDGLAAKKYHELYQIESPDFVLMFIPIDTAFSVALESEKDLYNYAFEKNIVIVTASTLLATLKTVETMWRNDYQNKYALNIADEAGKMYDKFVGFIEDMEKLGNQVQTVQNTYRDSMKKLCNGSGNLVRRAEKIKALGAKASKTISPKLQDVLE